MVDKKNDTADEERSEYIAGLRALADFLDAHPEIRLPTDGAMPYPHCITLYVTDRDAMQAVADALRNTHEETTGSSYHYVHGQMAGLHVAGAAPANKLGGRETSRTVTGYEVEPFVTSSVPA